MHDNELQLRIQNWLLNSNIQIASGTEKGAIAGWLNDTGTPEFAYLEATGYYLTCMAFMLLTAPSRKEEILKKTDRAFEWLYRNSKIGEMPPTRRYLCGKGKDWRNSVVFSFDLAMVIRGLILIRGVVDELKRARILTVLGRALAKSCVSSGALEAFSMNAQKELEELPKRWSTTDGPYQLKAAAALSFSVDSSLPESLKRAAEKLYLRWGNLPAEESLTGELHADFYFLEGVVLFASATNDAEAWMRAALGYQTLWERHLLSQYFSPAGLPASRRSDVVAQALRLGCILWSQGRLRGDQWRRCLTALRALLRKFVNTDGAVSFHRVTAQDPPHWNSWCAMFAYQALTFYQIVKEGKHVELSLVQLLI